MPHTQIDCKLRANYRNWDSDGCIVKSLGWVVEVTCIAGFPFHQSKGQMEGMVSKWNCFERSGNFNLAMLVVNQYPFQASCFEANYFWKISKIRWSDISCSLAFPLASTGSGLLFSIEAIPQAVAYKLATHWVSLKWTSRYKHKSYYVYTINDQHINAK